MDQGSNVQDENLINDQVADALAGAGAEEAPVAPIPTPVVVAPVTEEPVIDAPVAPLVTPLEAPAVADEAPAIIDEPETVPVTAVAATDGGDDELMGVKQKALEQLSPLVGHLDLPPEKKFDTYMEIIRASDDKSLIQPAFDAAQEIVDDDKKAQALLDVVNEVNYLTQDHPAESK